MGLRLAVLGDLPHHRDDAGRLCTLEPFVRQLDCWAAMFDGVVLCMPLEPGPPLSDFAPYRSTNIRIEPVRSGGGNTFAAKLAMLRDVGPWMATTRRVARSADAVHIRCPSNIGLIALVSTIGTGVHRHALYAGVWRSYRGQPLSYRIQRRLLMSRWFGGPVSIYGDRDAVRPHLAPFFSPSFSLADWERAGPEALRKIERIRARDLGSPVQLVAVGRLTPNKNQATILHAVRRLLDAGVDVRLDVYGEGFSRPALEHLIRDEGLGANVQLHGAVSHEEVMAAFARADLHVLSTKEEGFGKVLLEGMVHATVPILSTSPVASEVSGDGTRGLVMEPDDVDGLVGHVMSLMAEPDRWADMASNARTYARSVSLESYQAKLHELLEREWGVTIPLTAVPPETP